MSRASKLARNGQTCPRRSRGDQHYQSLCYAKEPQQCLKGLFKRPSYGDTWKMAASEAHLSVGRLCIGVVAAKLGLGLREAAIGPAIAASSRVLGGAVSAATPVALAATCGVCA